MKQLLPSLLARLNSRSEDREENSWEEDPAMLALRGTSINLRPSEGFNTRVVRRWRLDSERGSLRYWSPAMVGAVAGGLALLAMIQILSQRPAARPSGAGGAFEARLETNRAPLSLAPRNPR